MWHHPVMFAFREKTVWIIAVLGILSFAPSIANAAEEPCNGSSLLCERTLDQVVLPGTHNSMSAEELDWLLPNQTYSITGQLERGVRSLLFDTYYGEQLPNGKVAALDKAEGEATDAQTYMCHALCQLGFVDLGTELGRIADFLAANPREALVFINEDYIAPEAFAEAVTESGLLPYVYQGSATSYPTLEEMIDSGQRVVMLAQSDVGDVPWYHLGYDGPMMETPYSFEATPESPFGGLDDPSQLNETCRANRGLEGSPLFLMNHWVTTGVTPEPGKAAVVNTKEAVVDRARACEARRGKLPNIVAVDFFGQGDVIAAARNLNAVEVPILTVTKPKAVTVKAKRKAIFRIPIRNTGDAEASSIKVCAKVPAKLARKARCFLISSIPVNGATTAKLSIVTKKRFKKGFGQVRFTIYSSQSTLNSAAKLTVKPLKKPRKQKKRR